MSGAYAATPPSAPSDLLGRSAALVHAILLLGVIPATALGALATGHESEQGVTIISVGLASALILWGWAFVLSVRAVRDGERLFFPVLIGYLMLVEACVPAVLLWKFVLNYGPTNATGDWAPWHGVPVYVPLVLLATVSGIPVFLPLLGAAVSAAAPLAWWIDRREKRRSEAEGGVAQVTRWGLVLSCLRMAALLWVLLLPVPLYFYCAVSLNGYYGWRPNDRLTGWRKFVAKQTPDIIRQSVYDLIYTSQMLRGKSVVFSNRLKEWTPNPVR